MNICVQKTLTSLENWQERECLCLAQWWQKHSSCHLHTCSQIKVKTSVLFRETSDNACGHKPWVHDHMTMGAWHCWMWIHSFRKLNTYCTMWLSHTVPCLHFEREWGEGSSSDALQFLPMADDITEILDFSFRTDGGEGTKPSADALKGNNKQDRNISDSCLKKSSQICQFSKR